ncbi:MAG: FG-GAP repeat domain-containing protein [Phycisphaerales bacterium]
MRYLLASVFLGLSAGTVCGQSFPIRALSEPVMPVDDDDPLAYAWESGLGTMERVGDVNGDGVDDLVVLIVNDDTAYPEFRSMFLFLGQRGADGSVSFGVAERIAGFEIDGDSICSFELHDHDGDGLDDLLVMHQQRNSFDVWLSTGEGFVLGTALDTGLEEYTESQRMLIGDLGSDGDMDYVLYNTQGYEAGAWTNLGDGSFAYEEIGFLTNNDLLRAALIDVDGDGDLDMAGLIPDIDELYVVENTDMGWVENEEWLRLSNGGFEFEDYACFADVNGDGSLDVVARGESYLHEDASWGLGVLLSPFIDDDERDVPFVAVPEFENLYSHVFQHPRGLYHPDANQHTVLRSAGDLDGDGTDDLLYYPFGGKTSGWRIMDPMNLNGRRGVSNELSVHGEGVIWMDWVLEPDRYAYREVFSDVNGDGVKDKIVATFAQRPEVFQAGDGGEMPGLMVWGVLGNPFNKRVVFDEQDAIAIRHDANHVLTVDLDNDQDLEIMYTSDVYLNAIDRDHEGLLREIRELEFHGAQVGFRSVVASMDGDPYPDILSLRLNGVAQAPAMFLNPMIPHFGEGVNNAVEFNPSLTERLEALGIQFESFDNSFAVGDVDGDGAQDIVIRGEAMVYDTDEEMKEQYSGEAVLSWIGDGIGGLGFGAVSPIRELRAVRTFSLELIDFNRDGLMDVVSVGDDDFSGGYVLQVLVNEGDGVFGVVQEVVIDAARSSIEPYWMEIEDLDGDGYQDVMVLLKNTRDLHQVAIVYGSETGLAADAEYVYGGNAAELIAVDLDGNGLRDLLTCSYESDRSKLLKNSVSIMFQMEARVFSPIVSINDLDMSTVNVADLNGDGGLDLIAGAITTAWSELGRLIRVFYSVPAACRADLNLDGALDYFDVSLFVQLLSERRAIVDLDGDGAWGVSDVQVFLEMYVQGCE